MLGIKDATTAEYNFLTGFFCFVLPFLLPPFFFEYFSQLQNSEIPFCLLTLNEMQFELNLKFFLKFAYSSSLSKVHFTHSSKRGNVSKIQVNCTSQ